ncbi:hypothetical protein [Pseudonocardia charpentierae]|uniref:Uncharacterized protein n=1 Tax=Pseudonocardia charpentierae TaxID=3075545 RepID=A0ABU2NGS2_9PSEU|nr:hypothetical protein [Pseudonocardia sp. DSM 45834]MDT0353156.1 hypothetical protein [Pseudonocardia sp. DSM 45834]
MARYLVVAHETVTSPELLKAVRGVRDQDAEAEFVLLVPATPVRHLLFRKGDEHDAEVTARKRGERATAVFTRGACRSATCALARPTRRRRSTRRSRRVQATPGSSSPRCRRRSPGGCGWICPAGSGRNTGCRCTTLSPKHRLTWGHGSEMVQHDQLAPLMDDQGVVFAYPASP